MSRTWTSSTSPISRTHSSPRRPRSSCVMDPARPRVPMALQAEPMSGEIAIRPYELRDVEALCEAAVESAREVSPWLPWCHAGYSVADSRTWIEHCVAAWAERSEYNFAVVDAAGRYLGGCGLNQLRPEHRIANLGYWIRTS